MGKAEGLYLPRRPALELLKARKRLGRIAGQLRPPRRRQPLLATTAAAADAAAVIRRRGGLQPEEVREQIIRRQRRRRRRGRIARPAAEEVIKVVVAIRGTTAPTRHPARPGRLWGSTGRGERLKDTTIAA